MPVCRPHRGSNGVGYTTITAPLANQYAALTVTFKNCGAETAIPVANLLTVADPKGGASANNSAADQIWRWNSSTAEWTKYYYRKLGTQAAVGWCLNGKTSVTTDTIPNGETFFFFRGNGGSATTVQLSGEVVPFAATPIVENLLANEYRFIGYPWPVGMPIAGFEKWQGDPKGGASANNSAADQIWRWNSSTAEWTKYYYRKLGTQAAVGWCLNGKTSVTTDTIPAGEGFFFFRGNGGSTDKITFTYEEKKAE